ncbi:MAG TPA: methionine--tRNA ligase subunit beta [Negativicutes bacterium]|nr:methionine--tRNA ligase subunit beta [Negativicutes bacterium]
MTETISFDDFKKVEIRVGKIVAAEKIESSNKLLKLQVDFGAEQRQILAGLVKFYTPEQLIGKLCPFAFNLAPKKMGELESQGMILCADSGEAPVLLHPDKDLPTGSIIK